MCKNKIVLEVLYDGLQATPCGITRSKATSNPPFSASHHTTAPRGAVVFMVELHLDETIAPDIVLWGFSPVSV